jgi:hypothetical protein
MRSRIKKIKNILFLVKRFFFLSIIPQPSLGILSSTGGIGEKLK